MCLPASSRTLGNEILKTLFDERITLDGIDWAARDAARQGRWPRLELRQTRAPMPQSSHARDLPVHLRAAKASCEHPKSSNVRGAGALQEPLPKLMPHPPGAAAYICHARASRMLMSLLDVAIARDIPTPRWTEFGKAPRADCRPHKGDEDAIAKAVDEVFAEESKGGPRRRDLPLRRRVVYFSARPNDRRVHRDKRPGDEDYGFVPSYAR